jgi:microcin C transport system permease protein
VIFVTLFALSLLAEGLSNDRPLVVRYDGHYFPIVKDYPETQFGGDFPANRIISIRTSGPRSSRRQFRDLPAEPPLRHDRLFRVAANPAPPSASNWLGTDQFGRDVLARLLYGFRLSVLMAFALSGVAIGMLTGALQGFYGGRTDLVGQRLIEIWSALPDCTC